MYPRSVSTPFDTASKNKIFVKYLLWFGALSLGWNEGRVLLSYGIFQTSWVKPAPYACQPKNKASKTPRTQNAFWGGAADEVENRSQVTSVVLYFVRVRISHTNHYSKKSARAVNQGCTVSVFSTCTYGCRYADAKYRECHVDATILKSTAYWARQE